MDDIITMSKKELTRAQVMQQLVEKRLKQAQAAHMLSLSVRQVKRLLRAFRQQGAPALLSQRRGQPSNHQLPAQVKVKAQRLLQRHYSDFGPTLAQEKLAELHGLQLSVETVRQLMIASGLWQAHRARRPPLHQLRARRSQLGELVQIDGSPHDWFEGRAARCTLLVFIDDATGRLLHLRLVEAETTFAYFDAAKQYFSTYGKPRAFYADKFSVFRPTRKEILHGEALTQFGRAMQELGIEIICANTPQAKGRVERVNQTLQDRLVKELRLRKISHLAEANDYLSEFMAHFNRKFTVQPASSSNAHRPLLPTEDLEQILVVKEKRVLSKNLTLSYDRVIYQIVTQRPTYTMRGAGVVVCKNSRGEITILYKGKKLDYRTYHQQPRQAEVKDAKQIALGGAQPVKKNRPRYVPPADHPWRRFRLAGSLPTKQVEEK